MDKPIQEIEIEELVKRLRAKLGNKAMKADAQTDGGKSTPLPSSNAPQITPIDWDKLNSRTAEAESLQYVWTTKPRMEHYRGFTKAIATVIGKVVLYFSQVVTKPQQAFNTAIMRLMNRVIESLRTVQNNVQTLHSHKENLQQLESGVACLQNEMEVRTRAILEKLNTFDSIERQIQDINTRLNAIPILEKHLSYFESRLDRLPQLDQETRAMQERLLAQGQDLRLHSDNLNSVNLQLNKIHEHIEHIWQLEHAMNDVKGKMTEFPSFNQRLHELKSRIDLFSGIEHRIEELKRGQESLAELKPQVNHVQEHLTHLMTTMVGHEQRLAVILDEARRRMPHPFNEEQLQVLSHELEVMEEEFYLAFENKYRGSRQEIKERLRIYLPMIRKAGAGSRQQPILDVGCGRGEWLEVLKEEGLVAFGLDLSNTMVEHCHVLDLKAEQGDVLEYLKQIKDESLGAVTGFHIIEHLPFKIWLKVFDETLRVLKTGGVVIFETPNPENVLVAGHSFYMDPSHIHPLPSELVKFTAEARGFHNVEVLNLHPWPEEHFLKDNSDIANRFNHLFYGPQDYAVIAWKG